MRIITQNAQLKINAEQLQEIFEDDFLSVILISLNNVQVTLANDNNKKQVTIEYDDILDIIEKETNPLAAMLDLYDYFSGIGWCIK